MKIMKKAISVFAIISIILSALIIPASAKNVCNEISGKSGTYGGNTKTFYADAKNTKSHFIKVDCEKGKYQVYTATVFDYKSIYDYLNVTVYGKKGNSWKKLSDTNYKNKSSFKITFSGYKEYKFVIHSWKVETIEKSAVYFPHPITKQPWLGHDIYWKVQPTWRVKRTSGMTDCSSIYY